MCVSEILAQLDADSDGPPLLSTTTWLARATANSSRQTLQAAAFGSKVSDLVLVSPTDTLPCKVVAGSHHLPSTVLKAYHQASSSCCSCWKHCCLASASTLTPFRVPRVCTTVACTCSMPYIAICGFACTSKLSPQA